jgi:threonine dehydrogenase-like Zn-dependent dehydrogenase
VPITTLDPFGEEMGRRVFELTAGTGFAAVFECSGVPDNIQKALDWVARGGDICVVSMIFAPAPIVPMTLNFKEARLTGCYSNTHAENRQCLDWMAEGRLDGRPLITDVIDLAQLPTVLRDRIDTGQAIKVIVETGAARRPEWIRDRAVRWASSNDAKERKNSGGGRSWMHRGRCYSKRA